MRRTLLSLIGLVLGGCVAPELQDSAGFVVTYYDRNHDGVVDVEYHRLPGGADTNWALVDTKFSGHYDLRIYFGLATMISRVSIPVPRGVPITPAKPPVWIPSDAHR